MNPKSARRQFFEEGYQIYPGVFEGAELKRLREACDRVLEKHTRVWDREHAGEDFTNMRHLNEPCWHRDGLDDFKIIMETIADPRCLGPVEQIFGGPSLFRCTSYFVNPRLKSAEGNWHRDSQFMVKGEEEEKAMLRRIWNDPTSGYGIQFQIPLLDNDDIEYVPYSAARYDSPEEYHIRMADNQSHNREDGMPNALRVSLKAGDGVIFNPFGLHRGRYHVDRPRRTLMLTYTPRKYVLNDFFTDQPWFEEPGHLDPLSPRAKAFFEDFIHTYRDFWAAQKKAAPKAA